MIKRYKITCKECGANRKVEIKNTLNGKLINWLESDETANHNLISGRHRLDENFGWQCKCGNNTLMTEQEKRMIENYAQPKPAELSKIVSNLEPEPETNFEMEKMA